MAEDFSLLKSLQVPSVLENLRLRSEKQEIYTWGGEKVLFTTNLQVNSKTPALPTFDLAVAQKYRGDKGNTPHPFAFGNRILRSLDRDHKSQCLIPLGVAGSGKTFQTYLTLKYLAWALSGESKTKSSTSGLVDSILDLIRFFTQTKTTTSGAVIQNDATRGVSLVRLFVTHEKGHWTNHGVHVDNFLLEKNRISRSGLSSSSVERNFHIFYSLFGLNSEYLKKIGVDLLLSDKKYSDFQYLRAAAGDACDEKEFETQAKSLVEAFEHAGLSNQDQQAVLRVLSGILYLGNVMPFKKQGSTPTVFFDRACQLLGIDSKVMVEGLTSRLTISKGHKIYSDRSPTDFVHARDSLCAVLYDRCWQSILQKINKTHEAKQKEIWVGITDQPGFQTIGTNNNSLEQLLINYADERLQQVMTKRVIADEQLLYEKEGLRWKGLDPRDRSGCLTLLHNSPSGIIELINHATHQKYSPRQLIQSFQKEHGFNRFLATATETGSAVAATPRKAPVKAAGSTTWFIVRHYMEQVIYETKDFATKDSHFNDVKLNEVVHSSSIPFISSLLVETKDVTSSPSKPKPMASLGVTHNTEVGADGVAVSLAKFMDDIVGTIQSASLSFLRCIRPTESSQSFDNNYVTTQITNQGLSEVLRMMKNGYPYRIAYDHFLKLAETKDTLFHVVPGATDESDELKRYLPKRVILRGGKKQHNLNIKDFIEACAIALGISRKVPPVVRKDYRLGSTQFFLRAQREDVRTKLLSIETTPEAVLTDMTLGAIEKNLTKKRIMRMRGTGLFLGVVFVGKKRTFANKTLQASITAALGVKTRDLWLEGRKRAAQKIATFLRWCQHDRKYRYLHRSVDKICAQIKAEKKAELEKIQGISDKNKVPLNVLADLASWLSGITGRMIPSTLIPALRSGEILCDLLPCLNRDLKVTGVHRDKKQPFFWRDNVNKALRCLEEQMECPPHFLFSTEDLLSDIQPNYRRVAYCIQWIARHAFLQYEKALPTFLAKELESGDIGDEEEDQKDKKDQKGGSKAASKAPSAAPSRVPTPSQTPATSSRSLAPLDTTAAVPIKDLLAELKEKWFDFITLLMTGAKFDQYNGNKVFSRWVRLLLPKSLREEPNLTFEQILENIDEIKFVFTTVTDRTAPTGLVPFNNLLYVFSGKRDKGKCFPKGDESAVEEKCLVIGTIARLIGLQADSQDERDTWFTALEWCLSLLKYVKRKDQEEEKGSAEAHVLDPLLVSGAYFTKHGLKGVHKRFVKCTTTHIYWLHDQASPLTECVDPINWEEVVDVLQGKQTVLFTKSEAVDIPDSLCLSIVYRKDRRTLDLVAENKEQAYEWYQALHGYFAELHEKYHKEYDAKIQSAKSDLEAFKQTVALEELAMKDRLAKADEELKRQREILDGNIKQLESQVATVSLERDDLMARVQELTKKVEETRHHLDEQLREKEEFIIELSQLRGVSSERDKLKKEVEEENRLLRQQAEEVRALMGLFGKPWDNLHGLLKSDVPTSSEIIAEEMAF